MIGGRFSSNYFNTVSTINLPAAEPELGLTPLRNECYFLNGWLYQQQGAP